MTTPAVTDPNLAMPDLSREIESVEPMGDILPKSPQDDQVRKALTVLYGAQFPLLKDQPSEQDWVAWAKDRWTAHAPGIRARLHITERNRLYRKGTQWISAIGLGPWRQPPKPRDAARIVDNMIRPALDLRCQIVAEQRPGFRVTPATQDPDDLKKADAQQTALEYQYSQMQMERITRELSFWNGTDGVAFLEVFWNPERGPWHEIIDEAPTKQDGVVGSIGQQTQRFPLGDVDCRVRTIEQVRVSSEATANIKPWYWIIRDVMTKEAAVREYGADVADASDHESGIDNAASYIPAIKSGFVLPDRNELLRDQDKCDRFTIYCDRSEYLPHGLQLIVVGEKMIAQPMPLLAGVVPMVRYTDGSSDPSFYPEAIMDGWIDCQQRINAIKSKWVENIRLNASPRLLAKMNTLQPEEMVGGMNVWGVKGLDDLSKTVRPLEGMSLSVDAKELLAQEIKRFEDLSGWNDVTRGSFSSEQSGRAILAIREQLERVFAPPVSSTANGHTDWAKVVLAFMHWGYDLPRVLGVEGKNRPDLARELSADDFDGAADVFIDPETMMPMPRAMRQFLLDDLYAKQLISPAEYRRRSPYANTRNLGTADDDQEAMARRIVEQIRQTGQPPQMGPWIWIIDEAIHQDVLDRELLMSADTPPPIMMAAWQWWTVLAQQAQTKMGGVAHQTDHPKLTLTAQMSPLTPEQTAAVLAQEGFNVQPPQLPPGGPMQGPPQRQPTGPEPHGTNRSASPQIAQHAGMTAGQQPLMGSNPSVPNHQQVTDQQRTAQQFDQQSQR